MESKNNIFCATNPARMTDALWHVMETSNVDLADMLIFLPSRRAVRGVEKMIVARRGGAAILPRLVALGEGADEFDADDDDVLGVDILDDATRLSTIAAMVAMDANIGTYAAAIPVARDLMRMSDYLENEGHNPAEIDWSKIVDEKYAAHFRAKAQLLNIISRAAADIGAGRVTVAANRNARIRAWIEYIASGEFKLIIVCGSTASVPATADLMAAVANDARGRIILPGRISDSTLRECDMALVTNPYNSEYKFLSRIGVRPTDVREIDVGASAIEFMNAAFGNDPSPKCDGAAMRHCHIINAPRESIEAAAVAEIAARAVAENKTVLVITPDAAGNQRIATAFAARGLTADFSGGRPASMTCAGRAILNLFDDWIENDTNEFERLYAAADGDLFETIVRMIDARGGSEFTPPFDIENPESIVVWDALRRVSDAVRAVGIEINVSDARAFVADALGSASVRGAMNDTAPIVVLGTIESRMQSADVVILTGLNDGMFPARGYENAWIPRAVAAEIGIPSGDRKVSLMSLDFMNLSCGANVWWTRSRVAGGVQTTESRFLSRVAARHGMVDTASGIDILNAVARMDDVPRCPLNYSAPMPPADWSDVYVTELELLAHNPYAFYVRHILRLRVMDDYWAGPDARTFGNLVHDVLEHAAPGVTPDALVARMDAAAHAVLGANNGVLFQFWHRRFMEIAPVVANELLNMPGGRAEIGGHVKIANRTVRARADRVWTDGVMDIKTGAAPNKKQLLDGNMPQLPLEAYMHQSGGFASSGMPAAHTPVMKFLQLRAGDVRVINYDAQTTAMMIRGAIDRVTELFNMYSAGAAPYEYYATNDAKYRAYDDLARVRDND